MAQPIFSDERGKGFAWGQTSLSKEAVEGGTRTTLE